MRTISKLSMLAAAIMSAPAIAQSPQVECDVTSRTSTFFNNNGAPETNKQKSTFTIENSDVSSMVNVSDDGESNQKSGIETFVEDDKTLVLCLSRGKCTGELISSGSIFITSTGTRIDVDNGKLSHSTESTSRAGKIKMLQWGQCKVDGLRAKLAEMGMVSPPRENTPPTRRSASKSEATIPSSTSTSRSARTAYYGCAALNKRSRMYFMSPVFARPYNTDEQAIRKEYADQFLAYVQSNFPGDYSNGAVCTLAFSREDEVAAMSAGERFAKLQAGAQQAIATTWLPR